MPRTALDPNIGVRGALALAAIHTLLAPARALEGPPKFTRAPAAKGHPFLRYDAFLFDGFGTLHDNARARPGAAEAIRALTEAGKLVIVGSNAPHDNAEERAFLQELGVTCGLATDLEYGRLTDDVPMVSVFTSGHVARASLRNPGGGKFAGRLGDRPHVLGMSAEQLARAHPPGDSVVPSATVDAATCLVAYGSAPTVADVEAARRAGELKLPFLAVAGDDVWAAAGLRRGLTGVEGLVAEYKRAGGEDATIFGKPHRGFFRKALSIAKLHGADELCVVGDSLAQDVCGARDAGLPVAWLYEDVHTDEGKRVVGSLARDKRRRPDYVLRSLHPPAEPVPAASASDVRVDK